MQLVCSESLMVEIKSTGRFCQVVSSNTFEGSSIAERHDRQTTGVLDFNCSGILFVSDFCYLEQKT